MFGIRKFTAATSAIAAASLIAAMSSPAVAHESSNHGSNVAVVATNAMPKNAHAKLPNPDLMVPIWVTLGSRIKLPYAQLTIRDGSGKVVEKLRSNANGIALIKQTDLPLKYSIAVTGGKSWKLAGKPALQTREVLGSRFTAILVSPVTSIASMVAKKKHLRYAKALTRTKNAISIPDWATAYQFSTVPNVFDGYHFRKWGFRNGGSAKALKVMANRIAAGKSVPDFSPSYGPKPHKKRSTAEFLGETAMSAVMEGSYSMGMEAALGDAFGLGDPDADELASIEGTLKTISSQLTTIQNQLDYLTALMQETSMETLNSGMATLTGNVSNDWPVYDSALQLDPTSSDYQATIASFATQFYNDFDSNMGEISQLFNTSTSNGLIANIYAYNTAPWWNLNDVTTIQSQIDYYGTIQAQAVTLLNEAWNYRGPGAPANMTPTAVNVYNTDTYNPQNAAIYESMPTQIDSSMIVVPSTQMIYKAFPTTVNQVYGMTYKTNADPTCSSMGSQQNGESYPTKQTNTTTWNNYWTSAVPSGWTVQSNSAFSGFDMSRSYSVTQNKVTTNYTIWSVPTFAANVPGGFAMVTTGEYPRAGFEYLTDGYEQGTVLTEYMWCYSSAVSLANTSSWVTNFATMTNGTNVPAGAATGWIWDPIPVGVLGAQQGTFEYQGVNQKSS